MNHLSRLDTARAAAHKDTEGPLKGFVEVYCSQQVISDPDYTEYVKKCIFSGSEIDRFHRCARTLSREEIML